MKAFWKLTGDGFKNFSFRYKIWKGHKRLLLSLPWRVYLGEGRRKKRWYIIFSCLLMGESLLKQCKTQQGNFCAFQLKEKKGRHVSLSIHIFKLWKFQTEDQMERNLPKLSHLSLLQLENQTIGTSQIQWLAYQNTRDTVLFSLGSYYQRLQLKTKIPFLWCTAIQKNTSHITANSKTFPSNTSTSTFRRQTLEGKCSVNHYFYN